MGSASATGLRCLLAALVKGRLLCLGQFKGLSWGTPRDEPEQCFVNMIHERRLPPLDHIGRVEPAKWTRPAAYRGMWLLRWISFVCHAGQQGFPLFGPPCVGTLSCLPIASAPDVLLRILTNDLKQLPTLWREAQFACSWMALSTRPLFGCGGSPKWFWVQWCLSSCGFSTFVTPCGFAAPSWDVWCFCVGNASVTLGGTTMNLFCLSQDHMQ